MRSLPPVYERSFNERRNIHSGCFTARGRVWTLHLHDEDVLGLPLLLRAAVRSKPSGNGCVALVPDEPAPANTATEGTPVRSFVFTSNHQRIFDLVTRDGPGAKRAFHAVAAAADDVNGSIDVVCVNSTKHTRDVCSDIAVAWIIPHRGADRHLRGCLARLRREAQPRDRIMVGFDQATKAQPWKSEFPNVEFYQVDGPPVGPYVFRDWAWRNADRPFVIFQDSDDVPLPGRRRELVQVMAGPSAPGICGTNELRLDYMRRKVIPVRFPDEPSRSLREKYGHAMLFPTSGASVSAIAKARGFSTNLVFGLDTQYLLRAVISGVAVANISQFVYLRRKRAGSLTTDPATKLGSPLREGLLEQWRADFSRILGGETDLMNSSLACIDKPSPCSIRSLGD